MPADLNEFLIALSVVQDYQLQLVEGANRGFRDKEFELTVSMDKKFEYFAPCIQVVKEKVPYISYEPVQKVRQRFDCYIDFDFHQAWHMTKSVGKHAAESLGILIGASPRKWPMLGALQLPQPTKDVLVINWQTSEETSKLWGFLADHYPELSTYLIQSNPSEPVKEIVELINDHRFVIGPKSASTYLAATLGKNLIEIFPTQSNLALYANWETQAIYQALVGDNIPAELVWSSWEARCETFLDSLKAEHAIQTAQSVSSVGTVAGK